jgi:serine/threonine-protein kinase RIM15
MERSLSQDIREEREELREAAEQTLNTIVDLNLDGTIKWVSPSWTDVVGTQAETVEGLPISDLIVSDNKTVFAEVVESMKKDDSRSHRVRFAVQLGGLSKLLPPPEDQAIDLDNEQPQNLDLEAQGIMVYDSVSGGESHVSFQCPSFTPLLVC